VRLKVNASNVIGQKDEEIRITGCRDTVAGENDAEMKTALVGR